MNPVIIAFPDMLPLAAELTPLLGAEPLEMEWQHFPDGESLVTLPPNLARRDVASSGQTLVRTLNHLRVLKAEPAVCVIIHAVFAGSAYEDILAGGADGIVTTNSIPHESNEISIGPLLAEVTRRTGAKTR